MANSFSANITELNELYKVPESVADRFQNIMVFAKNMVLKDSLYFEESEDAVSREFGNLLLKYYDSQLTNDDIFKLLSLVRAYNNGVDDLYGNEEKKPLTLAQKVFRAKNLYGLYDLPNANEEALLNIKIDKLESYTSSYLYLLAVELNKYYNKVVKPADEETKKGSGKYTYIESSKNDEYNIKNITTALYRRVITNGRIYTSDTVASAAAVILSEDGELYWSDTNITSVIEDEFRSIMFEDELLQSKKILFKKNDSVTVFNNKRSASLNEKTFAENGELLNFFDLKIKFTESDSRISLYKDEFFNISGSNNMGDNLGILNIQILYKELNPRYRALLFADNVEYVSSILWKENISELLSKGGKNESVGIETVRYARNVPTSLVFYDELDDDNNIVGTTKLYKYAYTNAYMARRAEQSSLIRYFVADPYVSNNYGRYNYEKLEINQFIDILKETRFYYYRVLLNESFINEEHYDLYEKLMITFMAVNRFIISKIDNLKDIDTFSRLDIENFMKSFGLEQLAGILEVDDFINSETYSKRLLKYYIPLSQYKGSREVVDILRSIFSIGATELTVSKNVLVNYKTAGAATYGRTRTGDTPSYIPSYKFLRMENDDNDIFSAVDSSIDKFTDMQVMIGDGEETIIDKYWNQNNTHTDTLTDLGLDSASTKYIIPEVEIKIAETYANVRILFAYMDYIFSKFKSYDDFDTVIDSVYIEDFENLNAQVSFIEYIEVIRYLFSEYFNLINIGTDKLKSTKHSIKISDNREILSELTENTPKIEVLLKEFNSNLTIKDIYTIETVNGIDYVRINPSVKNLLNLKDGTSSYNTVIALLESLAPIALIDRVFLDEGSGDIYRNAARLYYFSKTGEISRDNIITSFNTIATLPNAIIHGDIDKLELPAYTYNLLMKIYNAVFIEDENPVNILLETDKKLCSKDFKPEATFITDSLDLNDAKAIRLKIIEMLNYLSSVAQSLVSINLSGKDNTLINFLKYTIEYFISYTNEIYDFRYSNSYNTLNENAFVRDAIVDVRINHTDIDSLYYDERLEVTYDQNSN